MEMAAVPGRAEYLTRNEIAEAVLFEGNIELLKLYELYFSKDVNEWMLLEGSGNGKTFLLRKTAEKVERDHELGTDIYTFNKEKLKWNVEKLGKDAKVVAIDDFNYAIELGYYCELIEQNIYDSNKAANDLINLYKMAKENGKKVLIASTDTIGSLSDLITDEDSKKEFINTFKGFLVDDDFVIARNYINGNFVVKPKEAFSRFSDIRYKVMWNRIMPNLRKCFPELKEIPLVIPSATYVYHETYHYHHDNLELKLRKGILPKDIHINKFGDLYSGDLEHRYHEDFFIGELLASPRKLELAKDELKDYVEKLLKNKPPFLSLKDIRKIRGEIDKIFAKKTRGIDWYQLVKDISEARSDKEVKKALLRYRISEQTF